MGKSNKPSWDSAPEWANWLACDSDSPWYWYEEKPLKSINYPNSWTNHPPTKFNPCDVYADASWAEENWNTSVEQRPKTTKQESSEHYLSAPNARRVTLFIDFDESVHNDEQLAQNIAEMLCNRLGTSMSYPGSKFTPGGGSVERIRIAIGKELMNKIAYDTSDGFYVESKEND